MGRRQTEVLQNFKDGKAMVLSILTVSHKIEVFLTNWTRNPLKEQTPDTDVTQKGVSFMF